MIASSARYLRNADKNGTKFPIPPTRRVADIIFKAWCFGARFGGEVTPQGKFHLLLAGIPFALEIFSKPTPPLRLHYGRVLVVFFLR